MFATLVAPSAPAPWSVFKMHMLYSKLAPQASSSPSETCTRIARRVAGGRGCRCVRILWRSAAAMGMAGDCALQFMHEAVMQFRLVHIQDQSRARRLRASSMVMISALHAVLAGKLVDCALAFDDHDVVATSLSRLRSNTSR